MNPNRRDLPKNDLPLLILATLEDGPRHGYGIARAIEGVSETALRLREGSLYPALRVLEQDGYLESAWEVQPSGPARKVYTLTGSGRAELQKRRQEWEQYARFVGTILRGGQKPNEQPA